MSKKKSKEKVVEFSKLTNKVAAGRECQRSGKLIQMAV